MHTDKEKHAEWNSIWIAPVNPSSLLSQLTRTSNFSSVVCLFVFCGLALCFCVRFLMRRSLHFLHSFWRGAGGTCRLENFWSPLREAFNWAPHLGWFFFCSISLYKVCMYVWFYDSSILFIYVNHDMLVYWKFYVQRNLKFLEGLVACLISDSSHSCEY